MSIQQRIKKAEKALQLTDHPIIYEIAHFAGGPLPPEQRRGNIIVRRVPYESTCTNQQGNGEYGYSEAITED